MKRVQILSDYTSENQPNILQLIRDEQGDIHINMRLKSDSERGVRIANHGTRYSSEVRQAFYNLIDVLLQENNTIND